MPAGLGHLTLQNRAVTRQDAADLRRFLIWVPDPRSRRGRRYPMLPLLCAAASAVLAGARSLIAIGEWITDAPQSALEVLDFPAEPLTGVRPVPHPATVRRLLQPLDGDALDACGLRSTGVRFGIDSSGVRFAPADESIGPLLWTLLHSAEDSIGGVNRSRYTHLRMVTRPPFLVISLECGARQSPVHWLAKV
ncbi:transposase family protein [Kitasatospora purpeofusca]|uniref:transposase family protein n=1 Tax=Kitasatospora purpeofusca TaxID=67352 RepID=UPI002E126444|nr:transposase family protein [Kitasatospora purpeofusca]